MSSRLTDVALCCNSGLRGDSFHGNTRLWDRPWLARLSEESVSRISKLCSHRTACSWRLPDQAERCCNVRNLRKTCSRWSRAWLAVPASHAPLHVALSDVDQSDVPGFFRILPDVNANSVRAIASGGVPEKTSSRSPHTTCCAKILARTQPALHVLQPLGTYHPEWFGVHPARTLPDFR